MNNVSFCGKLSINKKELANISLLKRIKFAQQRENISDEFYYKNTAPVLQGDEYIFSIKDEKEELFIQLAKRFGLNFKNKN